MVDENVSLLDVPEYIAGGTRAAPSSLATTMQPNPVLQFVPLMIISVVLGFVARGLAKDKGRNILAWTVLGFIPVVNIMCTWYFVGATNLRLERKIDALLSAQGKDPKSFD